MDVLWSVLRSTVFRPHLSARGIVTDAWGGVEKVLGHRPFLPTSTERSSGVEGTVEEEEE